MADIILRSAKGSNLTPSEVDSNFKKLNDAIIATQAVSGAGTVKDVAVDNLLGGVVNVEVTGSANEHPVIKFNLIGSAGYVKSAGNNGSLSTVSTIPFADTTGTVPISRGGTNLTSVGSNQTFLGSTGSELVYRTISTPNSTITATWTSSNLSLEVNQSALNITSMTGILPVNKGGTGATTAQEAINILTSVSTIPNGQVLSADADNATWKSLNDLGVGSVTSVGVASVGVSNVLNVGLSGDGYVNPTINVNLNTSSGSGYVKSNSTALILSTTIPTSDLSGSVAIANGGTGQATQQAAINALTGASSSTVGKAFITDSSNNAVWSSSFSVGDVTISSRRILTTNTTLSATDYFVGFDGRTCTSIWLPNVDSLSPGKIIVIKDTYGVAENNPCTIFAYNPSLGYFPTDIDLVASIAVNKNFQSVELILSQDIYGNKHWYIKSIYKP